MAEENSETSDQSRTSLNVPKTVIELDGIVKNAIKSLKSNQEKVIKKADEVLAALDSSSQQTLREGKKGTTKSEIIEDKEGKLELRVTFQATKHFCANQIELFTDDNQIVQVIARSAEDKGECQVNTEFKETFVFLEDVDLKELNVGYNDSGEMYIEVPAPPSVM